MNAQMRAENQKPRPVTDEEHYRLNEVRKDMWTGGFTGLAAGMFAGSLGCIVCSECEAPGTRSRAL